jgi:serine protease Do
MRHSHLPCNRRAAVVRSRSTGRRLAGAALLTVAAALAFTAAAPPVNGDTGVTPGPRAAGPHGGFADLVERVQPAVVNIATRARVSRTSAPGGLPFQIPEGSPFAERFREFFGNEAPNLPRGDTRRSQGVGSGFIVDADGHVVTNHHVIQDADEIVVTLDDGTEHVARVVGHDEKTDLALLKLDHEEPLPHVTFGSSRQARVGDWVVAVGSPFGLGGTVTAGILSARGRDIRSGPFDDFLQIDAPINRGNSGGPLFDQSGQVIGVNTAIFSPSGGSVGIGFAIPSELAAQVVAALKEDGRVERGWMGVTIQGMTPELAESFGLDEPRGALVSGVQEGGPAHAAGVLVGDVILRFGDEPIESMRELPRVVAAARHGESVEVEVLREGERRTLRLDVGRMPGSEQVAAATAPASPVEARLGITLSALDDATRGRLGLDPRAEGVVITEVAGGSPAARKGLRPGDVILRVGAAAVSRPEQVADAVGNAAREERSSVVMLVSRDGNERFVAVPFARG